MTIAELLSEAATGLVGVLSTMTAGGGTTWSRGGRPFAVVSADGFGAEFGLDPGVAAAAVRTPDVVASERGPGWVAFAPAELDDHAIDRAVAWFTSAHRRAGPRD